MKRIVHFAVVAALAIAFVPASTASAAINPATAASLAAAMEVPSGDLTGVSINGSDPAGTGVGNSALGGFPTATPGFAILSTGLAASADLPDGNNGELLSIGTNTSDDISATLGGLDNGAGYDLVQLRLELNVPIDRNCATIDFKFLSEEWPDFYLSNFNDTFLAQLNPVGVPGFTITGNNVSSAPRNFAFDATNQVLSVNSGLGLNPLNTNPDTGTTYDGATATLSASTPVPSGTPIVIQFSVTDLGDNILDSAVFLDNFRWGATTAGQCVPGARINTPPTVDAGTGASGTEGSAISLDGTVTDIDAGQTVTSLWTYAAVSGVDGGATCSFGDPSAVDTTITCNDDGVYEVTLTGDDGVAPPVTDTALVTVSNADPTLAITSPADGALYPVNTVVTVTGDYTDAGSNDTHTCTMNWDPDILPDGAAAAGTCTATKTFATPGVYTITMTVTDDDGGSASDTVMVVVYDPSAGFVTGGGRIESPAGAYPAEPTLAGMASFGFVSKYKKGAITPTGQTEFQFQAADFNFHSELYQWLVVAGCRAQYKGTGTVNGVTGYGFLLTATDGRLCGGGPDRLRMKVWRLSDDVVVYDNKIGSPDDIDAAAPEIIAQGSIVIHK